MLLADTLTNPHAGLSQAWASAAWTTMKARRHGAQQPGGRGSGPDDATCTSHFSVSPGFLTRHARPDESLQPHDAVCEDYM